MFEFDHVVLLGRSICCVFPRTVIKDIAVLVNFHEGSSIVLSRFLKRGSQVFHICIDGTSDKGCSTSNSYGQWS